MTTEPNMEKVLRDADNNIKHLCDMVNLLAGKLGLGRKVDYEDFAGGVIRARQALGSP